MNPINPIDVEQLLRNLPTLPAPAHPRSTGILPVTRMGASAAPNPALLIMLWLLLLLPTAWLLMQVPPSLPAETAFQATPYPAWQGLLHDAQQALQTGWQLIQEVLS